MLRWILYIFLQALNPPFQVFDLREQLRFTLVHTLQVPVAPYKGCLELLLIIGSKRMPGLEMFGRAGLKVHRPVLGCDFSAGRSRCTCKW
jgi:hypothetical protein